MTASRLTPRADVPAQLDAPPQRPEQRSDVRLGCVMDVLGGTPTALAARRAGVEPALVHRWVRVFTEAGMARLENRPEPGIAQQRDRFLAAFAHELRTPLAVAQGWTDILADGDLPPEMTAATVDKLSSALALLAERTREAEYLAAAALGRLRVTRRPVPASELLPEGEVPFVGDLEACVDTDPRLAARALRDLWTAALTPPRPEERELHVRVAAPWVELRVVRTGEPIEGRVLQALFDPFDHNDDATGVSTGLYLARALAVALGGSIGLEQDGERTAFWLRLPAPPDHPIPTRRTP
ncbi:Signal transduction histidine kinase [Nocardioides scoriae]|uniref:histidine kinase n=1 Tax=Nocardioides scoriae TaxID=642780 RepID=A0A1H1L9N8_9ACTN|nr:HAMP domain-containing sensor histidine kinase [Nocardioides scoriae]SDR71137.1 Signal transduction histidine kinase [Nocardioides scoriae]